MMAMMPKTMRKSERRAITPMQLEGEINQYSIAIYRIPFLLRLPYLVRSYLVCMAKMMITPQQAVVITRAMRTDSIVNCREMHIVMKPVASVCKVGCVTVGRSIDNWQEYGNSRILRWGWGSWGRSDGRPRNIQAPGRSRRRYHWKEIDNWTGTVGHRLL